MIWYPWLTPAYRQLVGYYRSQRDHHALLIQAQDGLGDELLVSALGRWLMCQHPQGEKTCGECHSCRLMMAGNHPDWHVLQPEKGKATLGIDRIRDVVESLHVHAQQGGAKVVWLPEAERLTESAANALLKTLEEPPEKTYFILSCREPSRLLPTVRSRCFFWHLSSPDFSFSQQWLAKQGAGDFNTQKTALALTQGAPLSALALLAPQYWQKRTLFLNTLQQCLQSSDIQPLLSALSQDNTDERLYWFNTILLDAIKYQAGANDFVVNYDYSEMVYSLAKRFTREQLDCVGQHLLRCRHELVSVVGVNKELILADCLNQIESQLKLS